MNWFTHSDNTVSKCISYRIVSSRIRQIFYKFLICCDIFREPLSEGNNMKIRETSKTFVDISRRYSEKTSLLLVQKNVLEMRCK